MDVFDEAAWAACGWIADVVTVVAVIDVSATVLLRKKVRRPNSTLLSFGKG